MNNCRDNNMHKCEKSALIPIMTAMLMLLLWVPNIPQQHAMALFHENIFNFFKSPSSGPADNTISDKLSTYENATLGIQKIQYPENWEVERLQTVGNANIIAFISPLEGNTDTFAERVLVQIAPFYSSYARSFSPEFLLSEDLIKSDISQKSQELDGFDLIESNKTSLSGIVARKMVFTADANKEQEQPDEKTKYMEIATFKDGKMYSTIFVAQENKYNAYLPTISKMIDSFRIADTYGIGNATST